MAGRSILEPFLPELGLSECRIDVGKVSSVVDFSVIVLSEHMCHHTSHRSDEIQKKCTRMFRLCSPLWRPLRLYIALHMLYIAASESPELSDSYMIHLPISEYRSVLQKCQTSEGVTYLSWMCFGALSSDHSLASSRYLACSSLDNAFHSRLVASCRAPRNACDPGTPPDICLVSSVTLSLFSW